MMADLAKRHQNRLAFATGSLGMLLLPFCFGGSVCLYGGWETQGTAHCSTKPREVLKTERLSGGHLLHRKWASVLRVSGFGLVRVLFDPSL